MRTKRIISNSLIISSLTYLSIEFISILKSKAKLKGYFHTISELSTPIRKGYSGTITSFSPLSNVFNTILIINHLFYRNRLLHFKIYWEANKTFFIYSIMYHRSFNHFSRLLSYYNKSPLYSLRFLNFSFLLWKLTYLYPGDYKKTSIFYIYVRNKRWHGCYSIFITT